MDKILWYKASMAGGGEFFIQYKSSSNVSLACWAKTWTTLYPPLLIQQTSDQCNHLIKWRIPSITLPNKEVFSTAEEIAHNLIILKYTKNKDNKFLNQKKKSRILLSLSLGMDHIYIFTFIFFVLILYLFLQVQVFILSYIS